ncbi:retrovirus-related Pol polyprotein from transposon 17.6 [Nephila pilipes]|uniref:Retrovirus-related Pol polyprotein from transposon 17.6 n=1 Tax=Nephila pilipes TaxID=299642 RepID=A0A8X6U3U2_NEPPI|nr:retrovirus-related Pol polyprotein from transposon 17.6 [Nephila pilipes]
MSSESKQVTSFVTHTGQYSFRVMPYGLKNAAATFQRTINQLLTQHRRYAEAYINDIIIFSSSWKDHLRHLEAALCSLNEANFTNKLQKSSFVEPQVKLLGHVAGSGKHSPDPEKVLAIKNLLPPKTNKDVGSLLGLLSYYRSYVPKFAEIVLPFIELTRIKFRVTSTGQRSMRTPLGNLRKLFVKLPIALHQISKPHLPSSQALLHMQ